MQLRDYIHQKRIRKKDFAKLLGISETHLVQVSIGNRIPSSKMALRIEELTNGLVNGWELIQSNITEKGRKQVSRKSLQQSPDLLER